MSLHYHIIEIVDRYVRDDLAPHARKRVEAHVENCEACRAALEEGERRLEVARSVRLRRHRVLRRACLGGVLALILLMVGAYVYEANLVPSPFDVCVMFPSQLFSDSDASLRVWVRHRDRHSLVEDVGVLVELADEDGRLSLPLSKFKTDIDGTAQPRFRLPDWKDGQYSLRITASPGGRPQVITRRVHLGQQAKVMLSSDRPVYKPGQIIRLRSLALRGLDLKPIGGHEAVFTVADPKDNVIFKNRKVASEFGISADECPLAAEILEGTYTIRSHVGEAFSSLKVQVKKHVLPQFKIDLAVDKPYYRPGEPIQGTVQAHYFFGKPVHGGMVELEVSDGWSERLKLPLSPEGEAKFKIAPLRKLTAIDVHLELEARLTDAAGQAQSTKVQLMVSPDPLRIEVVPDGGALVAGLPNNVFLLATTVDGRPAKVKAYVSGQGKDLVTNEQGVAQFTFQPGNESVMVDWTIRAEDERGHSAKRSVQLKCEPRTGNFLFASDRAVYHSGDTVKLNVRGCDKETVYVDFLKDGQTLATQTVRDGRSTEFKLPADLFGTIELCAYVSQAKAISRKNRIIYVHPPEQLRITATMDRGEYTPRSQAQLKFLLTDLQGNPKSGALSLAVVDERVFSVLDQAQDGNSSFFTWNPKLLQAPATTGSWSPALPPPSAPAADQQLLEQALFARSAQPVLDRQALIKELLPFVENSERVFDVLDNPDWENIVAQGQLPAPILGLLRGKVSSGTYPVSTYPENLRNAQARQRSFHKWIVRLWICVAVLAVVAGFACAFYFIRSIADWLVIAFIVFVLFALFVPATQKVREASARTQARNDMKQLELAVEAYKDAHGQSPLSKMKTKDTAAADQPHIREWFPETLLWRPQLITNDRGEATLPVDLADSITTWRLSASAVTAEGRLGASTDKIKVFQPFFVELRLPVALTRGDEVTVPVVVYNYLDRAQEVVVKLEDADWFDRLDQPEKRLTLKPQDQTKATSFRIRVKKVGLHKLTVAASGKSHDAAQPTQTDAVRREIEVVPNGRPVETAWNGALLQPAQIDVTVPADAVEDSAQLLLKIYPSTFSQVLEGLDSIFRMPTGCFEQTSSSTYPNVLALDYLKRTGKRNKAVEDKASAFIHSGYQRLLSFEVQGGGFDWFGNPPANRTLTAYGLLEFQDMARVHEVDPKLIERTRKWLLDQRQPNGAWLPEGHVPAGLPGQHISGDKLAQLSTTSYIAWAVFNHKAAREQVGPTWQFILSHRAAEIDDPHVLALVCNALLALSPTGEKPVQARPYLDRLAALSKATPDGKQVYWQQPGSARTTFYGHGQSGQVETTALAALALMQSGQHQGMVNAALTWLIAQRDPQGTWYSTQATVLALKALLAGNAKPATVERRIVLAWGDGRQQTISIAADQAEVMKLENLTKQLRPGANRLTLTDTGNNGAGYQVTLRYHEPAAERRQSEPFIFQVHYEKEQIRIDEMLAVLARVRNNQTTVAPMVMIELPVPAGFEVRVEDWAKLVQVNKIAKFQFTPHKILVYLRDLAPGQELELPYRLEAKMPVRIQVPAGRVYEYYDPAQSASSVAAGLTVLERLESKHLE